MMRVFYMIYAIRCTTGVANKYCMVTYVIMVTRYDIYYWQLIVN